MAKYRVPAEVRKIAKQAIEYNLSLPKSKRASMKPDGSAGTGMRTARRLASGSIDLDQAILMRAWFARHGESDKEAKARQDKTSKASIAWALWGGNPARRWVRYLVRQAERKQKE